MNDSIQNSTRSIRGRKILLVDDHRNIRLSLRLTLEAEGAIVDEAETYAGALVKIGPLKKDKPTKLPFDAVLLDIRLPDGSGLDILKQLSEAGYSERVIMISGEGTVQDAFKATQMGAFDYIEKPFAPERIIVSVSRMLDYLRVQTNAADLERKVNRQHEIIGKHPKLKEVDSLIARVAPTNGRVLIVGESGTGKELVARAIHKKSQRSSKPLIKVNCAAIPANLIESELFGHEKGSFTGAMKQRLGVFERADGATLFLDEIGELNLELQAKLLRVLQNGELNRVGGEQTITVDVRLVAATNRDLEDMIKEGAFREDLYFRLNVVTIHMPPLRERSSDIPELAEFFLEAAVEEHSLGPKTFSAEALAQLSAFHWPGNIRELRNTIERVAILSDDGEIASIDELKSKLVRKATATSSDVSTNASASTPAASPAASGSGEFAFSCALSLPWQEFHEDAGRDYLVAILRKVDGNISEAARHLCLERAYLHRLLKKLGIQRDIVIG